jgi:hypothetical protein
MGVPEAAHKCKPEAKLNGKHLGPANVAAVNIPARGQLPGLPLAVEHNAYAEQGQGVDPELSRHGWGRLAEQQVTEQAVESLAPECNVREEGQAGQPAGEGGGSRREGGNKAGEKDEVGPGVWQCKCAVDKGAVCHFGSPAQQVGARCPQG